MLNSVNLRKLEKQINVVLKQCLDGLITFISSSVATANISALSGISAIDEIFFLISLKKRSILHRKTRKYRKKKEIKGKEEIVVLISSN